MKKVKVLKMTRNEMTTEEQEVMDEIEAKSRQIFDLEKGCYK